jgi:hypothetical protein
MAVELLGDLPAAVNGKMGVAWPSEAPRLAGWA